MPLVTEGYGVAPKTAHDYILLATDFFSGKTLEKVKRELENSNGMSDIALENKWHSLVMQYL